MKNRDKNGLISVKNRDQNGFLALRQEIFFEN